MVAKVHESFDAGQFLTGSLVHFGIAYDDGAGDTTVNMKTLVETVGTRATVVILGADGARIAVENNGAWDAAGLEAALGADWTVTDFAY
jgi:hypothetical protein